MCVYILICYIYLLMFSLNSCYLMMIKSSNFQGNWAISMPKIQKTRDNVLLDPRQRLFNNFEKVQFWAKFDLLTPMGPGQEFSKGNINIVGSVLLMTNFMQKIEKFWRAGRKQSLKKSNFGPNLTF